MSGPPPCTTTGFIPTYLSSTTSRANSSRSAGSTIAAPPYLMTTVLPWKSRMYGSASRSVVTSRGGPGMPRVYEGAAAGRSPPPARVQRCLACFLLLRCLAAAAAVPHGETVWRSPRAIVTCCSATVLPPTSQLRV